MVQNESWEPSDAGAVAEQLGARGRSPVQKMG